MIKEEKIKEKEKEKRKEEKERKGKKMEKRLHNTDLTALDFFFY